MLLMMAMLVSCCMVMMLDIIRIVAWCSCILACRRAASSATSPSPACRVRRSAAPASSRRCTAASGRRTAPATAPAPRPDQRLRAMNRRCRAASCRSSRSHHDQLLSGSFGCGAVTRAVGRRRREELGERIDRLPGQRRLAFGDRLVRLIVDRQDHLRRRTLLVLAPLGDRLGLHRLARDVALARHHRREARAR